MSRGEDDPTLWCEDVGGYIVLIPKSNVLYYYRAPENEDSRVRVRLVGGDLDFALSELTHEEDLPYDVGQWMRYQEEGRT